MSDPRANGDDERAVELRAARSDAATPAPREPATEVTEAAWTSADLTAHDPVEGQIREEGEEPA